MDARIACLSALLRCLPVPDGESSAPMGIKGNAGRMAAGHASRKHASGMRGREGRSPWKGWESRLGSAASWRIPEASAAGSGPRQGRSHWARYWARGGIGTKEMASRLEERAFMEADSPRACKGMVDARDARMGKGSSRGDQMPGTWGRAALYRRGAVFKRPVGAVGNGGMRLHGGRVLGRRRLECWGGVELLRRSVGKAGAPRAFMGGSMHEARPYGARGFPVIIRCLHSPVWRFRLVAGRYSGYRLSSAKSLISLTWGGPADGLR